MKGIIFLIVSFQLISCSLLAKDYVSIDISKPRSEKKLILILPGLGSFSHGVKNIYKFYSNRGYDVIIPDYISRKGINKSISNLDKAISEYSVKEYQEAHVLSYIVGSWTFNRWLSNHKLDNLKSIVYDRSPLQERVPCALRKDLPFLSKLIIGNVIYDLCKSPYVGIVNFSTISIGIIIERIPTKLFLKHKETAIGNIPINWDVNNLGQGYEDYCYIDLNHDDLYEEFNDVGMDVIYFFKNGTFPDSVNRSIPLLDLNLEKK